MKISKNEEEIYQYMQIHQFHTLFSFHVLPYVELHSFQTKEMICSEGNTLLISIT